MRIAWTGPVAESGGVPGMGKLILEELVRQGIEVDVYLPLVGGEPPRLEPSPRLRLIVHRSAWRWNRWYSRTKPRALFTGLAARSAASVRLSVRLLIEHHRRPYDAVYQLSQTELFLLGRMRRLAPPIVVHPCTHAAGELRWHRAEEAYALRSERRIIHRLVRALLRVRTHLQPRELARAELVIGLSERFNQHLRADYGVPASKLRVVRTPVDLERFKLDATEAKARPRTILFISRISTRKGVEEVIQLSHRLADLAGTVRLLVIGGPTQWSDYTHHLARLNPKTAEYLGGVGHADLPGLLRAATMLIVPSRYEPGSIATAEALASGLPVVLSTEVGAGEVVSGPHVRFHAPGDVDSLERAVRSLLEVSETDEPSLRQAARENAEREFAVDRVVAKLIDALGSLSEAGVPQRRSADPSVTVCICTRGRPQSLAQTLGSIQGSTYPVAQVVVSDDAGDAATRQVCREAGSEVEYVIGPRRGLGANRNCAVAASRGELILFLDDDCLLGPEFLERAIDRLRRAERQHGVGRVIVTGRELNRGQVLRAHDQSFLGFQEKPYRLRDGLRSVVINAALFPAEAVRRVEFDSRLVYGYEEVDFAVRASACGYVIVECPDAINDHRPSPVGRERYDQHVDASRLHVTLRRYALVDRSPARAAAFAVVAPLHVLAADLKRTGVRGIGRSLTTLTLVAMMLWRGR